MSDAIAALKCGCSFEDAAELGNVEVEALIAIWNKEKK